MGNSQAFRQERFNQPNRLTLIENTPKPLLQKPTISRTGVYGVAVQGHELLLVRQQKGPHSGKWELPGGGIEAGETIECALRREFLEEVGMSFGTMQCFENLTAITDGIDEKGTPYRLHQVGLVYLIDGLSHSNLQNTEMEHAWIDPKQLQSETISPFVQEILALIK